MTGRRVAGSLFIAAIAVAVTTSGQQTDPCKRCKDAKAEWTWKANGYAVAPSGDEAHALAEGKAKASACKTSATYLDAQKLKCTGKCEAGELAESCEEEETPGCDTGTYSSNSGQWTFVCRKHHEGTSVACDKEEAKRNPAYSTCDVHVKAVRTLPCKHPECTAAPETQ